MLLHISPPLTILLLVTGVSAIVPPPEKVNVSCNNFQTTVYWNYTNQLASTSFKLTISGSDGHYNETVTADKHQYDLTPFIWKSAQHYMEIYWVKITAINGTHESKIGQSPTFTFNNLKTASIKCKLDFPPVLLSVKDMKATVSFTNPLYFYKELNLSHLGHDKPVYEFSTITDKGSHDWKCTMEEATCKHDVTVEASEGKICVRLNGCMYDSSHSNMVSFKDTERICDERVKALHNPSDEEPSDSTQTLLIMSLAILLSVFFVVIALITMAVCKAKAWTMTTSTLPKTLASKLSSSQNRKVINFPYESISRICAIEPAVSKSHSSLSEISKEDSIETKSNSAECERSPSTPTGLMYMEGELSESSQTTTEEVELISETDRPVGVHVEDSAETESGTADSEEEDDIPSGYDRAQRLEVEVEMGHGDIVNGYGPA